MLVPSELVLFELGGQILSKYLKSSARSTEKTSLKFRIKDGPNFVMTFGKSTIYFY